MIPSMIKLLRQGAIEKPWFFRSLMVLIALAFVISMGWFGFQAGSQVYVAKVDKIEISQEEYRRAYRNAYQFYRNLLKDDFNEDELGPVVINGMVERYLWLRAAEELQAIASEMEIVQALQEDRSFYRKGRFDPQQYRWVLSNSRPPLTPEQYERNLRDDLSIDKVKRIIIDGIVLTDPEVEEAMAEATDPELSATARLEAEERAVARALDLKKRVVLGNFISALRARTPVEINEALL
jgi:hypothetical protein